MEGDFMTRHPQLSPLRFAALALLVGLLLTPIASGRQ